MSDWIKCQVSNLWRNRVSGRYYARTEVREANGKVRDVWKSLQTDKQSVAKLKLPAALARIRAKAALARSDLTLGEAAEIYLEQKRVRPRRGKMLKPRSLDYRRETVTMLRNTWTGFDQLRVQEVSKLDCLAWSDRARQAYSWTRFNGMLESLKGIFETAIEAQLIEANPAAKIERAPKPKTERFLPSREQFTEILRRLDSHPKRDQARLGIRALAFTSLRPNEARNLAPEDVDLKAGTLLARVTKNGEPRVLQLTDQARDFFEAEGVANVVAALKHSPRRALMTICREMKLPTVTPYTFRRLHLTRLLEEGVDILAVAATAGHRDRGKTLLGHYAKIRPEHVREKVRGVYI